MNIFKEQDRVEITQQEYHELRRRKYKIKEEIAAFANKINGYYMGYKYYKLKYIK